VGSGKLHLELATDCGRMTSNPEVILKSFHEKAGSCQECLSSFLL
jgi:hypothetical protein